MVIERTTVIRVRQTDMHRLFALRSFERKAIKDVITYLIDHHEKTFQYSTGDDQL